MYWHRTAYSVLMVPLRIYSLTLTAACIVNCLQMCPTMLKSRGNLPS